MIQFLVAEKHANKSEQSGDSVHCLHVPCEWQH